VAKLKTITVAEVKKLRELTGAAMMECKHALLFADGDFELAKKQLLQRPPIPGSRK